ncbi:hypothetical protein F5X68DRAFT_258234 [Plectosphaerella plurivora]|uniref:Rhodopsin domain-containing protein n=1 Tax=Plectosphaerella plurivora TaxID=936078 RepID=A0A9P8VK01_9PEZI|nr:hypothetical protein F5X68DRAFT_258234 [Plectosphaerella plurivora]
MAPNDYGPTMNTSLWTLVGISLLFMSLRMYAKITKHRGLWWDDWVLIVSWIGCTTSVAINSYNVSLGFGMKPENFTNFGALETMALLGNIGGNASMFGIALSKTSFALTLLRVVEGKMKWLVWYIIVSINIFLALMVLFVWVQCNPPEKSFRPATPGTCWAPEVTANYMIFASAYSGFMDIVLALLPWQVIWGLQLNLKEKVGVSIAMSMGMLAGIVAFVKCSVLPSVNGPNFLYDGSLVVIWVNVEATTAIIGASIPVLRVFFKEVKSSARAYYQYGTNDDQKSRIGNNTTVITTRTANRRNSFSKHGVGMDDDSDKSILEDRQAAGGFGSGGIVRTNEITVDYTPNGGQESPGYEMDNLGNKPGHGRAV